MLNLYGRFETKENRKQFIEDNKSRLFWYKTILIFWTIMIISNATAVLRTNSRLGLVAILTVGYGITRLLFMYKFNKIGLYMTYIGCVGQVITILIAALVFGALMLGFSHHLSIVTVLFVGIILSLICSIPSVLIFLYVRSIKDLFE